MDSVDVVDVVSAVIWQLLKARRNRASWAITSVDTVTKDLGRIKYILTDELKKLLEDLLAAVSKMEDLHETFDLRRKHLMRMGFGRKYIFILGQMLNLKATVNFRSEKWKLHSEIHDIIKLHTTIKESVVRRDEVSDVVGLEEDNGKMVKWLTDTNSRPNQNLGLILISGQIGSGKTTLAMEIYKSSEIERHFEFRLWVSASEDPKANVFRRIWEQVTEDSTVDMQSTEKDLVAKIRENLRGKRCLVVFDAVRLHFVNIYAGLELSDEGNGSSLIMTTREMVNDKYEDDDQRVLTIKLNPLNEENAWKLFKKVSLRDGVPDMLKNKIIKICRGIPSAIVVLGRFLSTKKYNDEWSVALDLDQRPIEGQDQFSVSEILAWMNSDLPFGLRRCLLYFGVFPKGHEIPVRRLLRLWLAEGLVTDPGERSIVSDPALEWNPEETAVEYLRKLAYRGMIEIATWTKDGNPKTCRVPAGIVYDIWLSKAKDIFGLLHFYPSPTTPDPESSDASREVGVRRVAEHGDIKSYSRINSHIQQHLRSYLSFNTQNKDTPALEIGKFLGEVIGHGGFGLLRVLDLEHVYKPKLPHNLGNLYLLRYLGLRWTFLDTLPHSVSELPSLEILDVKHTYISSPPNSIWMMQHLRHLCLNETRLDKPVGKRGISLTGLQTLWGLFVDKKIPVKNGLDRSTNLKKLGLTFHLDNFEELNDWIASLKQLKSLRLRSKNEKGRPSKLELKPLSNLENLESLYLLGNLPKLGNQYFPQTLEVLTLSVSNLEEDPMQILAQLPVLAVLGLLADSYIGKDMVCPNGGFKSLKSLKLWMLKELETWTVGEGAMQRLEELEIRCCHKLKELPDKLNLVWIDKIILTNMEKKFEANVRDKIPMENSSILEPQKLPVRCHCQDDVKQV